ncbi:MAG: pilus assembly protein N-terminal domain-containing protein [Novosphingobium sp.]|nr:pilus assembly protein N-terminal domain-containing protein [Novosphingobium sp.]
MAPIATPESSTSNAPVRSRMKTARWVSIASAAILGAIVASHAAPASAADTIAVVLDQAKVLQLPPNTATIIVGNPLIADITMINRNTQLILTGKSFGQTNMIALDRKGNSIGESTVIVRAAKTGLLVQRGLTQETYSCEPRCQPTITLGDDPKFTRGAITAVTARSSAVSTASKN